MSKMIVLYFLPLNQLSQIGYGPKNKTVGRYGDRVELTPEKAEYIRAQYKGEDGASCLLTPEQYEGRNKAPKGIANAAEAAIKAATAEKDEAVSRAEAAEAEAARLRALLEQAGAPTANPAPPKPSKGTTPPKVQTPKK